MKWIFVFMYWLTTWVLKYFINFFELIWHIDFKHFSYYGTRFLTIETMKNDSIYVDGFNYIEKFICWCLR